MANFRQIHVSIWKDGWFLDLEPDEKLLFIYLFSNESTSLSGMYRLSKKIIAFETCIDKKRIDEILAKFETDNKVHYEGDVVWVVNMRRFHETKSDRVKKRIQKDIDLIPNSKIKERYLQHNIPYAYPMHTPQQLKEEEKEKEEEAPLSLCSPSISREIFTAVTNMIDLPASHRQTGFDAVQAIAATKKTKQEVIDYLKPYYAEWTGRKYSKTNLAWLTDWAVSGEIPPQKKNGDKPRMKKLKGANYETDPTDYRMVPA
jgi:uncharacterized protein (DUF1697 family)